MNDFMPWLCQRYIRPYLDEAFENTPERMVIDLMQNELDDYQQTVYDQVQKYCAVKSFLLGRHTGVGLEHAL